MFYSASNLVDYKFCTKIAEFQLFCTFKMLNILNSKLFKAQVMQTLLVQLWVACSLKNLGRQAKSFWNQGQLVNTDLCTLLVTTHSILQTITLWWHMMWKCLCVFTGLRFVFHVTDVNLVNKKYCVIISLFKGHFSMWILILCLVCCKLIV